MQVKTVSWQTQWKQASFFFILFFVMLISALTAKNVLAAWSSAQNIPGSIEDGMPQVFVDDTGMAHVLFLSFQQVQGKYPVFYARGQLDGVSNAIAWEGTQNLGVFTKRDFLPIVVDGSGVVHALVASPDDYVYYISNAARGADGHWNAQPITACTWSPDLTIDATGMLYATCTRGVEGGTEAIFFYRTPEGAWSAPINTSGAPADLVRNNKIATAGGAVHVFFDFRANKNQELTTTYSRGGINGGFQMSNFPASFGKTQGGGTIVAADSLSGNLYAGFVWGSVDAYYFAFTTSSDFGASWAPAQDLLLKPRWWYAAKSIDAYERTAYFVSEQSVWDDGIGDVYIYHQSYNETTGFSDAERLSSSSKCTQPSIAVNAPGKLATWVLGFTDGVYYNVGSALGPPPPTSTPTLSATPTPTLTPWGGADPPMPPAASAGKIAFGSNRDGSWNIYTMNGDGSEVVQLTSNAGDNWDPAWSPDGTRIAFASDRGNPGNYDLYLMNADGSNVQQLTNLSGTETHPTWMPDGSSIVFECAGSAGDSDICSLPVSAPLSEPGRLVGLPGNETFPAVLPDGGKIAFASDNWGNSDVFVITLANGELAQLTNDPAFDGQPAWSPDGQAIAFVSERSSEQGEIFVMQADGSEQVPLTQNTETDGYPSWSLTGQYLAFHTGRDGNYEIYVMSTNGQFQTNISNNPGEDGNIHWSPALPDLPTATPTATPAPMPTMEITLRADGGHTSIGLAWNATNDPGVADYQVLRGEEGSDPLTLLTNVAETFYADSGTAPPLVAGTSYCYEVSVERTDQGSTTTSNRACALFGRGDLWIPDIAAAAEQGQVRVPVNIRNADGLAIAESTIGIGFDADVLQPLEVEGSVLSSDYRWSSTLSSTNQLIVSSAPEDNGNPPALHGKGTLFWLTFEVIGTSGTESRLDLLEDQSRIVASGNEEVPLVLNDATLSVESASPTSGFVPGDLDSNGTVERADALLALDMATGTTSPTTAQQICGDVNGDNRIDAADATMILFFAENQNWPAAAEISGELNSSPVVLSVGNREGQRGATVEVGIEASDLAGASAGIGGGDLMLTYDATVIADIEVSTADDAVAFATNPAENQVMRFSFARTSPLTSDGPLARFTVHLAPQATVPATSPLTLANARLNDVSGHDFVTSALQQPVERKHGQITITNSRLYLPLVSR